jgi:tetratricopeptide (TPR) repeat protein
MLQVEELRRAMGFPADFVFSNGSGRERIKMIGNSVCPPVMEAVIESLSAG